ncbi:MAG: type II toxin-antitoxin system mRNA interferase toxin, RelE/StbE family [Alphaproteobacteria bacterium]|jgi:addiction module RelE/StbE family toxin|nr:type II toxin-antitoxin system mRNA interferase toxin, RelE/StbE family [Alphaproteobacteria bacterium]
MRLIYDPSAEADLNTIFDYIAHHNPRAAEDTIIRLEQTILLLSRFPRLKRVGRIEGTRELKTPRIPYRIVYTIEEHTLRILNVIHGRRNWP